MRRYLPSLSALHAFEAAARYMSFTRAAERVFKTQSAVSMQMRRLEERIGKQLFMKDGREFAPRLTGDERATQQNIEAVVEKM